MQNPKKGLENFLSRLTEPALILNLRSRKIAYANRVAESLFGFSAGGLSGIDATRLCPEGFHTQSRSADVSSGSQTFQFLHQNGAFFTAECHMDILETPPSDAPLALILVRKSATGGWSESERERLSCSNFLQNVSFGFVLMDSEGQILEVNPAFCSLLGYSTKELIGQSLAAIAEIPESQSLLCWLHDPARVDTGHGNEVKYRRYDGQWVWGLTSCGQYSSRTGTSTYLLVQDVTACRTAFQALRKSETRLQALVNATDEIVFEMDREGTFLHIWAENEALLLRPIDELRGRRAEDALPSEVSGPFLQALCRVLKTGRPANLEYSLDLPLGKRWFQARISPIPLPGGPSGTVSVVARDVSFRKKIEEDLWISEMRFQEMIENLQMAAIILDESGILIYANTFFFKFSGYTHGDVLGQNWFDRCLTESEHPWMKESWDLFMAQKEIPRSMENEIRLCNGETRWMSWNYTLLPTRRGEAPCCICLGKDITDRHRTMEMLERSNQIKTEFISTAAHELRTPLTTIMGFSELLLNEQSDSMDLRDRKEFLGEIHSKAEHLSRIVGDLLDLSRMDTGQSLPLRQETTDPDRLLLQVTQSFQRRHPEYAMDLELAESALPILADKGRLEQVMENLLGNAVKFSAPGSSIRIRGEHRSGHYQISVADQGCGMTPEQRERIFEKFYRADTSNTSSPGLGLGMCIVHQIVKAHGGAIEVASHPGQGTTVSFELPVNE